MVNDNMHLGVGEALSDRKTANFSVLPINDIPVLSVPATQSVMEDTELKIFGLNVFDVDHLDVDNSVDYSFEVSLFVLSGTLSVKKTESLQFLRGDGFADQTLQFTGTLQNVNDAIQEITYRPSQNFNSLQHSEFLSVVIVDIENGIAVSDSSVRGTVAIQVAAQNDPPEIIAPPYQEIMLSGLSFIDTDNAATDLIDVKISVDNPTRHSASHHNMLQVAMCN